MLAAPDSGLPFCSCSQLSSWTRRLLVDHVAHQLAIDGIGQAPFQATQSFFVALPAGSFAFVVGLARRATSDERRADAIDATASDVEYDTDARRAAFAQRAIEGGVDRKSVDGRVIASNANGRPGRQATQLRARSASMARPTAVPIKNAEIER